MWVVGKKKRTETVSAPPPSRWFPEEVGWWTSTDVSPPVRLGRPRRNLHDNDNIIYSMLDTDSQSLQCVFISFDLLLDFQVELSRVQRVDPPAPEGCLKNSDESMLRFKKMKHTFEKH